MKKLILITFFLFGCATVVVSGNAELAPSNSVCSKIAEKRVFYVLWGLVPITNNNLDDVIPSGKKVKVETKYTIVDFLISYFLGFLTINTKTAEVYECR